MKYLYIFININIHGYILLCEGNEYQSLCPTNMHQSYIEDIYDVKYDGYLSTKQIVHFVSTFREELSERWITKYG
jgi:hypothetical protein